MTADAISALYFLDFKQRNFNIKQKYSLIFFKINHAKLKKLWPYLPTLYSSCNKQVLSYEMVLIIVVVQIVGTSHLTLKRYECFLKYLNFVLLVQVKYQQI